MTPIRVPVETGGATLRSVLIARHIKDGRVSAEDVGRRITGTEMSRVLASADAAEGPRAFAEKRPPRWVGR